MEIRQRVPNKKIAGITSMLFLCFCASTVDAGNNGSNGATNGQPFQYLQNQIDSVKASLDNLNSQFDITLSDLEREVSSLQSQIQSLNSQMEELKLDSDSNASQINSLQQEITDLGAELASKQDILDGGCPSGSSLRVIEPDGGFICEQAGTGSSPTLYTVYRVSSFTALYRNGYPKRAYVACPTGMHPIGGGYKTHAPTFRGSAINVTDNRPSGFGWTVTASNTVSSQYIEYLRAYVLCKAY